MPVRRYVEENGSAAMVATKRFVGVTLEVNLRKHVTHMSPPSMNKAAHSGFETHETSPEVQNRGISVYRAWIRLPTLDFETHRRHHQKSKTGVSVVPQKDLCPPKIFLKKQHQPRVPHHLGYPPFSMTVISVSAFWRISYFCPHLLDKVTYRRNAKYTIQNRS